MAKKNRAPGEKTSARKEASRTSGSSCAAVVLGVFILILIGFLVFVMRKGNPQPPPMSRNRGKRTAELRFRSKNALDAEDEARSYLTSTDSDVRQRAADAASKGKLGPLDSGACLRVLLQTLYASDTMLGDDPALYRRATLDLLGGWQSEGTCATNGRCEIVNTFDSHMLLRMAARMLDVPLARALVSAGVVNTSNALWSGKVQSIEDWMAHKAPTRKCLSSAGCSTPLLHYLIDSHSGLQVLRETMQVVTKEAPEADRLRALIEAGPDKATELHKTRRNPSLSVIYASSSHYRTMFSALKSASLDPNQPYFFSDSMAAIDELLAEMVKLLLDTVEANGDNVDSWLASQLNVSNMARMTLLHELCNDGFWQVTRFVASRAKQLSERGAGEALAVLHRVSRTSDKMKRTPAHYAAIRWGDSSRMPVFAACTEFLGLEGAGKDGKPNIQNKTYLAALRKLGPDGSGQTPADLLTGFQPQHQKIKRRSQKAQTNGGWQEPAHIHDDIIKEHGLDNLEVCDMAQLTSAPTVEEAARLANRARPIVFRGGALNWDGRTLFRRKNFLAATGKHPVSATRIPYADEYFGENQVRPMTFQRFVETHMGDQAYTRTPGQENRDDGLYIFSNALPDDVKEALFSRASPPQWLQPLILGPPNTQFFLGSRGSGAPVHFHTDAWNFLAYGRKRWILSPPPSAALGTRPAADTFLSSDRIDVNVSGGVFECIQEAGDVMLVPQDWSHVTLNLADSIGLAFEMGYQGAMLG